MAKPTKIEQALFDVTTIPSDSMEQNDAPDVNDSTAVNVDDGEWIIETNYRGEVVNSYPKARNAGK